MRLRVAITATLGLSIVASCSDSGVGDGAARQGPVAPAFDAIGSSGNSDSGNRHISVLDDCDPSDNLWAPTGGCQLRNGDVTLAEFNTLLASPLSASVVGHPAWRNQPSYLKIEAGSDVRITNDGGRLHTFTKVAQFGGGRVPPLNIGLTPAPECILSGGAVDPTQIFPGGRLRLEDLAEGIHRYQCCIHPWMRALIKVQDDAHGGH
jgi:plastocyanin